MIQENEPGRASPVAFARMLWRHRGEPGMLIPLLQAAQDSYGYVPPLAIEQISDVTGIPTAEIYGVITFNCLSLHQKNLRRALGSGTRLSHSMDLRGAVTRG